MTRILVVLAALAMHVTLAEAARVTAAEGSRFSIDGTTNVSRWRCSGHAVTVKASVAATADEIETFVTQLAQRGRSAAGEAARFRDLDLSLSIPVRSLGCGNTRMERDMYMALRADAHRVIIFRFDRLVGHDVVGAHKFAATIDGTLTLAGVERRKQFRIAIDRVAPQRYLVRGTVPLHMTDFEVAPPVALMGLIRADDALTVSFTLVLTID